MAFDGPAIAVYGAANADIQAHSARAFKLGDSNPGFSTLSAGGVGRNIAENLARWGARVRLVSVFGDDELTAFLKAGCAAVGIGLDGSLCLADTPSPRYICMLDADGSLVGAVAAMDALDAFTPEVLAARYAAGDEADAVVLDANLPADTLAAAVARWKGKPLLLDTVSQAKAERVRPLLAGLPMIKPNTAEARLLTGAATALEAARALRALGVREAFVTAGAEGIIWSSPEGEGRAAPLSLPVVNVSGAGDAAAAALAWGAAKRYNSDMRARLAVAAASSCAASVAAVCRELDAASLMDRAQGVQCERIS